MRTIYRTTKTLLAAVALLAVSFTAAAYEVHVLKGQGAAHKAMDRGDYTVAIDRLEHRVKHETRYSDIQLTNLCTAYVVTRQFEKAGPVCDRAVEAKGDYVGTAYNSRGVLRALQGDYFAAMEDFEKASDTMNYPRPSIVWGDKTPSNKRFAEETEIDNSVTLAAKNRADADRAWARVRETEEAEALAAKAR